MKRMIAVGVLVALSACATVHQPTAGLSLSMTVLNNGQPFVSRGFANRLALLVIDEKYSRNAFSVRGPGRVVDKGESWSVTFANALVPSTGMIVPTGLTITIRKTNGEVISIT